MYYLTVSWCMCSQYMCSPMYYLMVNQESGHSYGPLSRSHQFTIQLLWELWSHQRLTLGKDSFSITLLLLAEFIPLWL